MTLCNHVVSSVDPPQQWKKSEMWLYKCDDKLKVLITRRRMLMLMLMLVLLHVVAVGVYLLLAAARWRTASGNSLLWLIKNPHLSAPHLLWVWLVGVRIQHGWHAAGHRILCCGRVWTLAANGAQMAASWRYGLEESELPNTRTARSICHLRVVPNQILVGPKWSKCQRSLLDFLLGRDPRHAQHPLSDESLSDWLDLIRLWWANSRFFRRKNLRKVLEKMTVRM